MVITRKKLEGLIADLDRLFPEPDPNAKIEDMIGCFKTTRIFMEGLMIISGSSPVRSTKNIGRFTKNTSK